MLIQPRSSTLKLPNYQPRASLAPCADRFTPSGTSAGTREPKGEGSRFGKALKGAVVGAGIATAASLALARTINPLGAIVIFCSAVVGGAYAANDGNIQPLEPGDIWDPFNPLSPGYWDSGSKCPDGRTPIVPDNRCPGK